MTKETRIFCLYNHYMEARELLPMASADMDKLCDSSRTGDIVGYPAYYDANNPIRIWPIPCHDCIVVKSV